MFIPKRKAIVCMLVTMISVVPFFLSLFCFVVFVFLNKLSCPSSHRLPLFLEFEILTCSCA